MTSKVTPFLKQPLSAPRIAERNSPINIIVNLRKAIELFQTGHVSAALDVLKSLQDADLDQAHCAIAGLIYLGAEQNQEALSWYDRAVSRLPVPQHAFARRALALQRLGRGAEALECYEQAMAADSLDASAYYNRGNLLREMGRRQDAIASYDMALRLEPAYPEALYAGATMLQESGQLDAAVEFYKECLRLNPKFCQAWFGLANALNFLARHEEAIKAYDAALQLSPGQPEILTNKGVALYDLGRHQEALESHNAALRQKAGFHQALLNRANVWLRLRQPVRALADCDKALSISPHFSPAMSSRGIALRDLGHIDEAIRAYDAAIALNPDFAHARQNRGTAYLLKGDFERGLEDYEYRWASDEPQKRLMNLPLPDWSGRLIAGERLLVFDEQGLGDVIQFSRYLSLLARAGVRVTFFCRKKLHRLLAGLEGDIEIVERLKETDAFDSQIGLSSLPFAFKTRLANIPAFAHYLMPEAERVSVWRKRIGEDGFRVGVCWQGNQHFRGDPSRSIPLAAFVPLAEPHTRFISLQVGDGEKQLTDVSQAFRLETLGKDFDSGADAFVDAAAVISVLDLVITCDTSIAHLAGALGRPVWLLLKPIPDWRWMLERSDSPWYPSMRLFRRSKREDWPAVIDRVGHALTEARQQKGFLTIQGKPLLQLTKKAAD
jgi:tetratricopeptide (TPR) repeat protein